MKWTRIASGVVGAIALFQTSAVYAQEQPWLDPRYREGIGYRVGDLELHPGVAGEFGYDSNMFLRDSGENVVEVLRARITPSLSLATLGEQRREAADAPPPSLAFRSSIAASYNEYISLDPDVDTGDFRNVGALINFDLQILPQRPWGGRLFGDLVRTVQPSNLSDVTAAFNRVNAGAGGELIWAPGGGLFDWRLGYRFSTVIFEEDLFENLDNDAHTISTRGRWKFLPRTAFLFDAAQSFANYRNKDPDTFLQDSRPLRARLGLNGLITQHLGFLAMGGWGTSFFEPGNVPVENYDGPIGQAQLTFYPTPGPGLLDSPQEASLSLSRIGLGYTRDFSSSYLGAFYSRDRGYVTASYFFANRVLFSLEGGISRVHFPTLYFPTEPGQVAQVRATPFNEARYDVSLFAEYRLLQSIGINATVAYESNDSVSLPVPDDPSRSESLSWNRFQGFVGARWFM